MMTSSPDTHSSTLDLSWKPVTSAEICAWLERESHTYDSAADRFSVTSCTIYRWKCEGIGKSAYTAIWHIYQGGGGPVEVAPCAWSRFARLMKLCGLRIADLPTELNICGSTARAWRRAGRVPGAMGYARLCAWLCDEMGVPE